ncbi:MAG: transporter substrate-binding domain-containing protein [Fusobacteriaceae bacterium]|nr:transporter substrate-binding domain-containing protein [Fusobacteriaceae bacterium]
MNRDVAKSLLDNYPDIEILKELKTEENGFIFSNIFSEKLLKKFNKELEEAKSDGTVDNLKKKYGIE